MSATPSLASSDFSDLPGAEFLFQGLADLAAGKESVPALLLEIAAPRLRLAAVPVPSIPKHPLDAEIRLYRLLGADHGIDAYSQYNALLRRLSSLCRTVEHRARPRAVPVPL